MLRRYRSSQQICPQISQMAQMMAFNLGTQRRQSILRRQAVGLFLSLEICEHLRHLRTILKG
jgi:hypothetical protein